MRVRVKLKTVMLGLKQYMNDGKIKVNVNSYGYIQLINVETGEKVVIGNIGGEQDGRPD